MIELALPLNLAPKLFAHSGNVKGGFSLPDPSKPHFVLGQKPNVPYCFMLNVKWAFGFMTFALDQNPVCSMVHGSKLTGEPDAIRRATAKSIKIYQKSIPLISLKKTKTDFPCAKIDSSADASEFIRKFYSDDIAIFESFFILLLNRGNKTIGYAKISQGGIVGTVVDATIIAKYCVEALAKSVILCHNHPSGTLTPSEADKGVTKKIADTLRIFDCTVLDHIILTEESYFSFADEGMIY